MIAVVRMEISEEVEAGILVGCLGICATAMDLEWKSLQTNHGEICSLTLTRLFILGEEPPSSDH